MGEDEAREAEKAKEERPKGPGKKLFQKGQSGNPGGKPKNLVGVKASPNLLVAMRRVVREPEERDRTQMHRECRAWLQADRKGFMSKLSDLEKAAIVETNKQIKARATEQGCSVRPGEADEGAGRVEELIQSLLEQAREEP